MQKLTGSEMKEFRNALVSAFPTLSALKQMVRVELDRNLDAITVGSLADRAFILIEQAEAEGWLLDLVDGARRANPGNPDLDQFYQRHVAPKSPNGKRIPDGGPAPVPSNLVQVQLIFEGQKSDFNTSARDAVRDSIAAFLRISSDSIRILSVESGSVKITIELSEDAAMTLLDAYARRDPELLKSLPVALLKMQSVPMPLPIDWKNPATVLTAAIKAVPVVKYALGVAGVSAVVAIATRGFGLDRGTAAVGTVVVIAFMVLLLILAAASRLQRMLRTPALVLTWSFLIMVIISCFLLITSFFFHVPQTPRCLFYDQCADIHPRDLPDAAPPQNDSPLLSNTAIRETIPKGKDLSLVHPTVPVRNTGVPSGSVSAASATAATQSSFAPKSLCATYLVDGQDYLLNCRPNIMSAAALIPPESVAKESEIIVGDWTCKLSRQLCKK
jgi:Effector-associated domain 1